MRNMKDDIANAVNDSLKCLFKQISVGTTLYMLENETNESFGFNTLSSCIDLYEGLLKRDKNSIDECLHAAESEEAYLYFNEEDAEEFLNRHPHGYYNHEGDYGVESNE